MIYWVLYGVLATTNGTTTIHVPVPLLFQTELKCLKTKELNEKDLINKYDKIDLICKKVELEK